MKIQELKLFNGLTEDELQRSLVCSQSNIVEYEKDDYIFSQGERPRWIYMILSGEVLLEQINMAGLMRNIWVKGSSLALWTCFLSGNSIPTRPEPGAM